jgi:undecaprenyl-diphosphatase
VETFQLIILSLVQGLTEFLPISSSAHLILLSAIINERDQGILFDIGVHIGTLLAAVIYFRKQLRELIINAFTKNLFSEDNFLLFNLFTALIPILIIGFLFRDFVETNLRKGEVIAYATIGFGLLLYVSDKLGKKEKSLNSLNLLQSFIIGIFQCLALIPGTSRSGITITAGLFLGLNVSAAARFSFLLAIPTIGVIFLAELVRISATDFSGNGLELFLASSISFVVAYASIDIFLRLIEKIGLTPFVIYRLLLGGWLLFFWL